MDYFATTIPHEEAASASSQGVASRSRNGGSVRTTPENYPASIRIGPTQTISQPENEDDLDITILLEAILGPYTRSRTLLSQRAFHMGIQRKLRQAETKIAEVTMEYNVWHDLIHDWMERVRRVEAIRNSFTPANYAAKINECNENLEEARVELRQARASVVSFRLKGKVINRISSLDVLVPEGKLEALRLLVDLAESWDANSNMSLLIELVERASDCAVGREDEMAEIGNLNTDGTMQHNGDQGNHYEGEY